MLSTTNTEKPKNLKPKIYKAMLLINAYTQNIPLEHHKLVADQEYILLLSPRILSYIIELSLEYSIYCKLIALRAIKFSQLFFQGLEDGDSHYLQLPYMSKEVFKKWQRKSKASKMKFRDYIQVPKENLGCTDFFDAEETKVIEKTVEALPKLNLEVKAYVKGSDKIYQGDLLTVDVNVTRKYAAGAEANSDAPAAIHSNRYMYPKQEILWLIVVSKDQRRIYDFVKLHRPFSTMHKEYQIFLEEV